MRRSSFWQRFVHTYPPIPHIKRASHASKSTYVRHPEHSSTCPTSEPQIIVCGDQSSGKSSVLEAISGVSFPIRSSLCTRFPTELVLRKSSQVGVCVSIVPHRSRSESEQEALAQFHEELDSFEGLPQLIENAKSAMGIYTNAKSFSNDLLRVEVSGPDRPHLTIVDLPGLIHYGGAKKHYPCCGISKE